MPLVAIGFMSFAFFPLVNTDSKDVLKHSTASVAKMATPKVEIKDFKSKEVSVKAAATALYDSLNLDQIGLSYKALEYAYKGYQNLLEKGKVRNSDLLTVVDFSQSSRKKRFYIINVARYKVLMNTYVAHGKNTGVDMATKFSNIPESLQSSLGFYITKGTYHGKHGLSLKLDGLEKGYNDKAEDRAIVLHGADYIGEHRKGAAYMGRSFGCPAVPRHQSDEVISLIKNGSVLFIYHPSAGGYLHGSKLLNG